MEIEMAATATESKLVQLTPEERHIGFRRDSIIFCKPEYESVCKYLIHYIAKSPNQFDLGIVLTTSDEYRDWLNGAVGSDIWTHRKMGARPKFGTSNTYEIFARDGGHLSLEMAKEAVACLFFGGVERVRVYRTSAGYHVEY